MHRLTQEEKSTTAYLSHRLEVRRIWLEKVLLFIIIGGISGGITFLGTLYLETYKSDLLKRGFLLESRMEGIKEIYGAHSQLTDHLFSYTAVKKEKKDEYYNAYQKSLSSYMKICNKWIVLFSEDFHLNLQCHYYIHEAVAYGKIDLGDDHFKYVVAIYQHFDRLMSNALTKETLEQKQIKIEGKFDFDETSKKNLRNMKSEDFFNVNFEKWKNISK